MACPGCVAAGYTQEAEGTHLTVRAAPGVVFVAIKRAFEGEQADGLPVRRMFVEMSVGEAHVYRRTLDAAIGIAAASAGQPSGLDGGAHL